MTSRSQIRGQDWKVPVKTGGDSQALLWPAEQPRAEGAKAAGAARTLPPSRPGLRALRKRRPRAGQERGAPAFERSVKGLAGIAQKRGIAARSWSKLETL